jgi:hypothetical protein
LEIHIVKKILIVLVLGFSLAHAGVGLEPSLFFDQQVPVVSATTPGGEVALIGVGREQNGFVTFDHRVADLLVDEDGDGEVRSDVTWSPRTLAVWAAADVSSGAVTVAAPEGQRLRLAARSGISLSGAGTLAFPGRTLDLMLVRAGDGAWLRTVVDGGPFDVDGLQDGVATIAPSAFQGPDRAAPSAFVAGDEWVSINADTLVVQSLMVVDRATGLGDGEAGR